MVKDKHNLDYEILKCIYNGTTVPTELVMLYIREYEEQSGRERKDYSDNPKALVEIFRQAAEELKGGRVCLAMEENNVEKKEVLKREIIYPEGIL